MTNEATLNNTNEVPEDDETLWTADDVARFSKTSRSWVYQKAAAGLLPCLKLGGLLRFDPIEVKKFFRTGGVPERKVIPLNPKHSSSEGR